MNPFSARALGRERRRLIGQTALATFWLLALVLAARPALAILPPADVDCCQGKDYSSDRCAKFKLDAATCEKKITDFAEFYRKFSAVQQQAAQAHLLSTTVARIEARLYYNHSGTFSPLIDERMPLRNVIIGESAATEPSNALRVDVVVKGAAGVLASRRQVTLEVAHGESGMLISRQSADVTTLNAAGEYHVAFMLQGTGCEPLKLSATVGNSTKAESMSLPFQCGE